MQLPMINMVIQAARITAPTELVTTLAEVGIGNAHTSVARWAIKEKRETQVRPKAEYTKPNKNGVQPSLVRPLTSAPPSRYSANMLVCPAANPSLSEILYFRGKGKTMCTIAQQQYADRAFVAIPHIPQKQMAGPNESVKTLAIKRPM